MPESTTPDAAKACTHASVGVLITDRLGRLLMFDRTTPPAGVAPVAGHVFDEPDAHNDLDQAYEAAARAEVREEVGLTVTRLHLTIARWADNRCRRTTRPGCLGHQWRIYWATVIGDLAPS